MESSQIAKKADNIPVLKFTKVPCIKLQYKWDFKVGQGTKSTTILSKMVKLQGEKSFRAGLKKSGSSTSELFFVTTNINKLGIRVQRVTYIRHLKDLSATISTMRLTKEGGQQDQTDGSIQLFTAPLKFSLTNDNSFIFNIYITGFADGYRVQDCGLIEHLWSSALNRVGTDFELIVEGKSFPIHKVVLAARSPVFEAQFKNESSTIESKQTIDAVDAKSMEQFLKFIYTGELDGPIIRNRDQLFHLAETYQVQTLASICRNAAHNIDAAALGEVAFHLKSTTLETSVDITPSISPVEDLFSSDTFELKCIWTHNLPSEEKIDNSNSKTTQVFQYQGRPLFQAHLEASKRTPFGHYSHTLTFLYNRRMTANCKINQVTHSFSGGANGSFLLMTEKKTANEKLLQVFTSTQNVAAPLSITFYVTMSRMHSGIKDKLMDSTWNKQLGVVARKLLADVEILVGDISFPAHRSILSSQSPVFEAMFGSGMKESQTGSVRIEDVDSDVFKDFLDYLYTGMLPPSVNNEELFSVADKYQVATLMDHCKNVDVEELTDVYLAL